MAGKKEAKQKAGPSGRKEKYRRETGEPSGVKDSLEDEGRKSAQETQKKEAHKDLKDQGEFETPSVTKRRQVRKVATVPRAQKKKTNALQGQEKPPRLDQCDRLEGKGAPLRERPRERQARAVKRKSKEKKKRSIEEKRTNPQG